MGDAATRAAKTLAAEALWGAILATPSAASAPVPVNGVDAIVAAFQQRPVVSLGELHGWSVEHDLIRRTVADERFPQLVHSVVVEFGSARYQRVMDRYIGECAAQRTLANPSTASRPIETPGPRASPSCWL